MTTIAEGLSALSTALGIVKTLRDIDRGVQEAEFKLQIANVTAALADAKIALVDAQQETKDQKEEIARLRTAVRHREDDMVIVDGFPFRSAGGKPVGRAYCAVCADEGRYLHLNEVFVKDVGEISQCPKCKANFGWHVPKFAESQAIGE